MRASSKMVERVFASRLDGPDKAMVARLRQRKTASGAGTGDEIVAGLEKLSESVVQMAGRDGAFLRLLDRYVFNDVEQCSTTALFTARADGSSASPARQDFCKACLWQVTDASIDLRDPNTN